MATTPQGFPSHEWGDLRQLLQFEPKFLADGWKKSLMPAKPPGKGETRREIGYLFTLLPDRAKRVRAIFRQINHADFELLDAVAVAKRDRAEMLDVIQALQAEAAIVVVYFKNYFSRRRPWHVSRTLPMLISRPGHPSYPSGHATQSMFVAVALSEVLPKCRRALLTKAREIGDNREYAGVHFPSDTAAGYTLARNMHRQALGESRYHDLLQRAARLGARVRCGH